MGRSVGFGVDCRAHGSPVLEDGNHSGKLLKPSLPSIYFYSFCHETAQCSNKLMRILFVLSFALLLHMVGCCYCSQEVFCPISLAEEEHNEYTLRLSTGTCG